MWLWGCATEHFILDWLILLFRLCFISRLLGFISTYSTVLEILNSPGMHLRDELDIIRRFVPFVEV
jgi:hypothetical protein